MTRTDLLVYSAATVFRVETHNLRGGMNVHFGATYTSLYQVEELPPQVKGVPKLVTPF